MSRSMLHALQVTFIVTYLNMSLLRPTKACLIVSLTLTSYSPIEHVSHMWQCSSVLSLLAYIPLS